MLAGRHNYAIAFDRSASFMRRRLARTFCQSVNREKDCYPKLAEEELIREGKAIILKRIDVDGGSSQKEVFYNPVQRMNRDLSLLVYLTWGQKFKASNPSMSISYLDAFTASGLRAIRVKKELPEGLIDRIVACDLSPEAIDLARHNLELNHISS